MPLDNPSPGRPTKISPAVSKLRECLGDLAEVRGPGDAEAPILSAAVKAAVFQWLTEIRAADDLEKVGVKPRRRAILFGPPGTGKTTLAHHLCARLGIPMILVGSETLVGKFLGDSAKNVAQLFDSIAKVGVPSLLFLDEMDAIGLSRDSIGEGSCSTELKAMLTVLLRKIEEHKGYCVGATNRPDSLDPALWRRFDMQISVDLPEADQRFAILKLYSAPFQFSDDDLEVFVDLTEGASPALLRGLMEGMKRALVINPRIKLSIDKPRLFFAPILQSLQPPPQLPQRPMLWKDSSGLDTLTSWPPQLPQNAEGTSGSE